MALCLKCALLFQPIMCLLFWKMLIVKLIVIFMFRHSSWTLHSAPCDDGEELVVWCPAIANPHTSISIVKGCFSALIVFLNANGLDQRRVVQEIKLHLFLSLAKLLRFIDAEQGNCILCICNGFWGWLRKPAWHGWVHNAPGAGNVILVLLWCSLWLCDIGKLLFGISSKK